MNKTFNLKDIVLKSVLLLILLLIAIFLISCSPMDDIQEKDHQNLVDVGKEEVKDTDENEEPEEAKDEEIIYIVENPLITYMKEDGLYYSYLDDGGETIIHEGEDINNPRISPDGNYIVYTFEGDLYVYNLEVNDYALAEEEIVSYAFSDEHTLIFSSTNKGLTKFDLIDGKMTHEVDDNIYENLTYAKDNLIYGKRILEWSDDKGEYATNVGIVQIDGTNLKTELMVEGIKSSEDEVGYDPTIFQISKDGRYIYLMEKFASGSMSADFGSLGVYDSESKKHTAFEDIYEDKDWLDDNLIVLPQDNNLAINPQKGNVISVIKGGGREMLREKEVIILDIQDDKSFKIVRFMDKNLVAKTPSFSLDGEKLFFSATDRMEGVLGANDEFQDWFLQSHNIYEYSMETAKVSKLTEETSFDIMPISMGDNIVFLRAQDNIPEYYSLMRLINGQEEILLEDIKVKDQFYGNIQTGTSMDLLLNSKKF